MPCWQNPRLIVCFVNRADTKHTSFALFSLLLFMLFCSRYFFSRGKHAVAACVPSLLHRHFPWLLSLLWPRPHSLHPFLFSPDNIETRMIVGKIWIIWDLSFQQTYRLIYLFRPQHSRCELWHDERENTANINFMPLISMEKKMSPTGPLMNLEAWTIYWP